MEEMPRKTDGQVKGPEEESVRGLPIQGGDMLSDGGLLVLQERVQQA